MSSALNNAAEIDPLGSPHSDAASVLDRIVRARRSVRKYDPDANFDPDAVRRSLERAVLAPNSSNIQTWEFHRIRSPERLAQAAPICLNQNAAKTARELIAVVVRTDHWRERRDWIMKDYRAKNPDAEDKRAKLISRYYMQWIPMVYRADPLRVFSLAKRIGLWFAGLRGPVYRAVGYHDVRIIGHKSAALAAQTFMLSMKAEGYDTCPMEGFDTARMKRLLSLRGRAEICMMIACGPGAPAGIYGDRVRVPLEEVVREH